MRVKFGTAIVEIHSNDSECGDYIQQCYRDFAVNTGVVDFAIELVGQRAKRLGTDSFVRGDEHQLQLYKPFDHDYVDITVLNDERRSRLGIMLPLSIRDHCLTIEYGIRVSLFRLFFDRGLILFHCAGVKTGEVVTLFGGPSGAGKTTAAANLSRTGILNDDTMLLDTNAEVPYAYSTPYVSTSGIKPVPGEGVLGSIYLVKQDSAIYVRDIPNTEKIRSLLENTFLLGFMLKREITMYQRMLRNIGKIVHTVTIQELHLQNNDQFASLITGGKTPKGVD